MSAPTFELRNGELVGEGCGKPFEYLARRIRRHCRDNLVLVTEGSQRVLDRLLSEYPRGRWWQGRSGELVESVCRGAARYVENLDNWTDEELGLMSTREVAETAARSDS